MRVSMRFGAILVPLLLSQAGLCADELILKDGKKIEWTDLHDAGDVYEVTTSQGTKITVKKDDVESFAKKKETGPLTGAAFVFDKKRKLEVVDLLAKLDLKKNVVSGNFTFTGGKLIGAWDGVNAPRLMIPYTPPEEYDVTMVLERIKDDVPEFGLGFIGGGNQGLFCLGNVAGVQYINGQNTTDNGLSVPISWFDLKKLKTITLMVRKEALIAQVEGKDFFAWKADWPKLSLHPVHAIPIKNWMFIELGRNAVQVTRLTVTAPKEKP
jgi:hypothetical protein